MATCIRCGGKTDFSLDLTGSLVTLGPASVAGVQTKFSARTGYRLTHAPCGWKAIGYVDGDHFIAVREEVAADENDSSPGRGDPEAGN